MLTINYHQIARNVLARSESARDALESTARDIQNTAFFLTTEQKHQKQNLQQGPEKRQKDSADSKFSHRTKVTGNSGSADESLIACKVYVRTSEDSFKDKGQKWEVFNAVVYENFEQGMRALHSDKIENKDLQSSIP